MFQEKSFIVVHDAERGTNRPHTRFHGVDKCDNVMRGQLSLLGASGIKTGHDTEDRQKKTIEVERQAKKRKNS